MFFCRLKKICCEKTSRDSRCQISFDGPPTMVSRVRGCHPPRASCARSYISAHPIFSAGVPELAPQAPCTSTTPCPRPHPHSGPAHAPPFPAHAPFPARASPHLQWRARATWSSMSGRRAGRYLNQLFMIPGGFGGSRLQRTAAARPRCGASPAAAEHESARGIVHEGKYRWACDFILVLGASGKALPA